MKVVVCKDEDAALLLARIELKQREIHERTAEVNPGAAFAVGEAFRGIHFVLIEWLQSQGFKIT